MVNGFMPKAQRKKAVAIIAPHAGYIYSGAIAGEVYGGVIVPDDVVLIGPNHTGLGKKASVMSKGEWETPLGAVKINEALASDIIKGSRLFSDDETAHLAEHSLEVQLPFIHESNKGSCIVPITVMHASYKDCEDMGNAIAGAIKAYKKDVLMIVSSDMNHYEPQETTMEKDSLALSAIFRLDAKGLLQVTEERDISMCGVIPAAIAIIAARALGAKKASVVRHSTSGDTSGDFKHVVGYAGVLID
jgi:AmmeMemoRadiSam system protein B